MTPTRLTAPTFYQQRDSSSTDSNAPTSSNKRDSCSRTTFSDSSLTRSETCLRGLNTLGSSSLSNAMSPAPQLTLKKQTTLIGEYQEIISEALNSNDQKTITITFQKAQDVRCEVLCVITEKDQKNGVITARLSGTNPREILGLSNSHLSVFFYNDPTTVSEYYQSHDSLGKNNIPVPRIFLKKNQYCLITENGRIYNKFNGKYTNFKEEWTQLLQDYNRLSNREFDKNHGELLEALKAFLELAYSSEFFLNLKPNSLALRVLGTKNNKTVEVYLTNLQKDSPKKDSPENVSPVEKIDRKAFFRTQVTNNFDLVEKQGLAAYLLSFLEESTNASS